MKISIHIHSKHSTDSKQSVNSIISQSLNLGYDAIAITDHNTVAGSIEANKLRPKNLKIITGAEFSTQKGHILALFIDDRIEKTCNKLGNVYDFEDLIKKVKEQDGLLFLAHPLMSAATADHSFIEKLDGYELINSRVHSSHKKSKADKLNKLLKQSYPNKLIICGSDAHFKSEIESAYMTVCDESPLKQSLFHIQSLHFKRSSMAETRYNNIINRQNMSLKFYVKQTLLVLFGLLYDLYSNVGRNKKYEIIRICKED